MATESDIAPDMHSESDASSSEKAEFRKLYEKYSDLCDNADSLAQPLKAIAQFVKKEGRGGERDG